MRKRAQGLRRGVGSFGSFAAGFSFVSILTTVFQLFGLGLGFGGAASFRTFDVPSVLWSALVTTSSVRWNAVMSKPKGVDKRRPRGTCSPTL